MEIGFVETISNDFLKSVSKIKFFKQNEIEPSCRCETVFAETLTREME